MALQSEKRSVALYLNLSPKLIFANVSARPSAGDLTAVALSNSFSAPQNFISKKD
jgi:hypothetical protein